MFRPTDRGGATAHAAACAAKGGTCPQVLPLRWGRAEAEAFLSEHGGGGFDVVVGTDLMYVDEAVVALVETLDVRLLR